MNKSKLRREIIFFRKKNFQENFKINSLKLIKFLRGNKIKTKIVVIKKTFTECENTAIE